MLQTSKTIRSKFWVVRLVKKYFLQYHLSKSCKREYLTNYRAKLSLETRLPLEKDHTKILKKCHNFMYRITISLYLIWLTTALHTSICYSLTHQRITKSFLIHKKSQTRKYIFPGRSSHEKITWIKLFKKQNPECSEEGQGEKFTMFCRQILGGQENGSIFGKHL